MFTNIEKSFGKVYYGLETLEPTPDTQEEKEQVKLESDAGEFWVNPEAVKEGEANEAEEGKDKKELEEKKKQEKMKQQENSERWSEIAEAKWMLEQDNYPPIDFEVQETVEKAQTGAEDNLDISGETKAGNDR